MREKVESLADAKLWINTRLKLLPEEFKDVALGKVVAKSAMDNYWQGYSLALRTLLEAIEEGEAKWRVKEKMLTAVYKHRPGRKALFMDAVCSRAMINYMMRNPNNFLDVKFSYDLDGRYERSGLLPEGIHTKGKIFISVTDNRDTFSRYSGTYLTDRFKTVLEPIYSFTDKLATDMDNDIVAMFYRKEDTLIGYFYQGEYHLWKK